MDNDFKLYLSHTSRICQISFLRNDTERKRSKTGEMTENQAKKFKPEDLELTTIEIQTLAELITILPD